MTRGGEGGKKRKVDDGDDDGMVAPRSKFQKKFKLEKYLGHVGGGPKSSARTEPDVFNVVGEDPIPEGFKKIVYFQKTL